MTQSRGWNLQWLQQSQNNLMIVVWTPGGHQPLDQASWLGLCVIYSSVSGPVYQLGLPRKLAWPVDFIWHSVPKLKHTHTHTHTHTHPFYGLCPRLPGWAGTRKEKPIWILLKQETVSGSGIRWAICKSAPCSSQITMPIPHLLVPHHCAQTETYSDITKLGVTVQKKIIKQKLRVCTYTVTVSGVHLQNNEADAVRPSISLSAYQGSAVNNAADFHVDDAVHEVADVCVCVCVCVCMRARACAMCWRCCCKTESWNFVTDVKWLICYVSSWPLLINAVLECMCFVRPLTFYLYSALWTDQWRRQDFVTGGKWVTAGEVRYG